ncbi:hypothetical protein N9936_01300 [bacterium]|nr:hypothetical protein [bacterium]
MKSNHTMFSKPTLLSDNEGTSAHVTLQYEVFTYEDRPYFAVLTFAQVQAYTAIDTELDLVDLALDNMEELCPIQGISVESDAVKIIYTPTRDLTTYEKSCEESAYQKLLKEIENDENPT